MVAGDNDRPADANQPALYVAAVREFDRACAAAFAGVRHDGHEAINDGHGSHEGRYTTVVYDPKGMPPERPDVAAAVLVGGAGGEEGELQHRPSQRGDPARDDGRAGAADPPALGGGERTPLVAGRGVAGRREQDGSQTRRGEPRAGPAGRRPTAFVAATAAGGEGLPRTACGQLTA